MARFISEEIEVEIGSEPGVPVAFTWREERYGIARILTHQLRLDHQRAWYRRKHRDWWDVATQSGEVFRLYRHRGPGRGYWVLYARLEREDM